MAYLVATPTDALAAYGPLVGDNPDRSALERAHEHIQVDPMTPTSGAEARGVPLSGELGAEVHAEIRQALEDWKVLVFRDQDIERADHRAFALKWGELEKHPFFKHMQPGQSDADVATLAKDEKSFGNENNWHNDVTWHTHPSYVAVLRAVEIPPVGGDTLWADTGHGYDLLPDDVKRKIDPLVAEHDWITSFGMAMDPSVVEELRAEFPPVQHPVVRVIPETGRKVLFVNMIFTQRILGMSEDESNELLTMLYRHIQRPEFQVRLRWQPNTIAMWDNRTCQHYASSDYYPQRRVMERISIVGDVPFGLAEGASRIASGGMLRRRAASTTTPAR